MPVIELIAQLCPFRIEPREPRDNGARDGAVLPILHLNGYKINNPTLLARVSHDELESLLASPTLGVHAGVDHQTNGAVNVAEVVTSKFDRKEKKVLPSGATAVDPQARVTDRKPRPLLH